MLGHAEPGHGGSHILLPSGETRYIIYGSSSDTFMQGLFFNEFTDGCDFLRNVNCGDKDTTEVDKTEGTEKETAEESESDEEEAEEEDPKSLKDILELVKAAGEWHGRGGLGGNGSIINC